jgi:NTE family protein
MTAFWPDSVKRGLRNFGQAAALDGLSRVFSPYDYGPFYVNPLRKIVQGMHFEHICGTIGPALFISATNVRTGKIRVFSAAEISPEVLLATTCLPTVFKAVEIVDPATGRSEAYWDGGYAGNPALFPLYDQSLPNDIVIVNINPIRRETLPRGAGEILDRINEISFNASLLSELRAINFVRRLIAEKKVSNNTMKEVYVHMIANDALMTSLPVDSKMIPPPGLIENLKVAGREAAEDFLNKHEGKLNRQSSVDLAATFS